VTTSPGFDARELFTALARHDVDYVTIGGIAIQAYGGQRLTQDLDIAIAESTDNLDRLAGALLDLDARILGPEGQRSSSVPTAPLLGSSGYWPEGPPVIRASSRPNAASTSRDIVSW
jgi:hypothetical protein